MTYYKDLSDVAKILLLEEIRSTFKDEVTSTGLNIAQLTIRSIQSGYSCTTCWDTHYNCCCRHED